jgi:hypothetical protein
MKKPVSLSRRQASKPCSLRSSPCDFSSGTRYSTEYCLTLYLQAGVHVAYEHAMHGFVEMILRPAPGYPFMIARIVIETQNLCLWWNT